MNDCASVLESGSTEDISDTIRFEVPSRKGILRETTHRILNHISETNLNMPFMHLAMEEALVNAMEHGNKFDHTKTVSIEIELAETFFRITIRDHGKGFDHASVPDPCSEECLRKRRGRGVFLMRKLMDEVTYRRGGSEVTLVKNL